MLRAERVKQIQSGDRTHLCLSVPPWGWGQPQGSDSTATHRTRASTLCLSLVSTHPSALGNGDSVAARNWESLLLLQE